MKKNSIYLLLLTFVLVAGCDRIERDEYMVATSGSGSNGQWTSGGVQRALVEKYTGPRCNNCPLADETLDALHEQYASELVIIAITPYNNPLNCLCWNLASVDISLLQKPTVSCIEA